MMILCELMTVASFYHTYIYLKLSLEQITRLYVVTIISTTGFGVLTEIIDIGSRKDKCVISATMYAVGMFSMLFGGHFEMLLLGRVVYGAASALHHSSFEGYVIHEHTSLGYPDDWLSHTFSLLTHSMAFVTAVSGGLGQTAVSAGPLGCVVLCCILFVITALYILASWGRDLNGPRFMLSGFLYNLSQTVQAAR